MPKKQQVPGQWPKSWENHAPSGAIVNSGNG